MKHYCQNAGHDMNIYLRQTLIIFWLNIINDKEELNSKNYYHACGILFPFSWLYILLGAMQLGSNPWYGHHNCQIKILRDWRCEQYPVKPNFYSKWQRFVDNCRPWRDRKNFTGKEGKQFKITYEKGIWRNWRRVWWIWQIKKFQLIEIILFYSKHFP